MCRPWDRHDYSSLREIGSPKNYSPRCNLDNATYLLVGKRNAQGISTLAINCQPVLVHVVLGLADKLLFVVDYSASAPHDTRVFSAVNGNRPIIVLQDVAGFH